MQSKEPSHSSFTFSAINRDAWKRWLYTLHFPIHRTFFSFFCFSQSCVKKISATKLVEVTEEMRRVEKEIKNLENEAVLNVYKERLPSYVVAMANTNAKLEDAV